VEGKRLAYRNIITRKNEGIGWVIMNRPDKLNALNRETIQELHEAFKEMDKDEEVKAVILTGSGEKAFVAGADIGELAELDLAGGMGYAAEGQKLTLFIENFRKPVIAAVNGYALGGGTEIALCCHIRIASENAKIGQPEVKLGLIPGFGGTQRLARLVGKGSAMELILSGKIIDAKEAQRIGLVNSVVPAGELSGTAEKLAKDIIANAPLALAYGIQAINEGLDRSLPGGLEAEAELFGKACQTEDSKEGTRAFLEKRKPDFKGK
jgi:enoyl-CoA hydratase